MSMEERLAHFDEVFDEAPAATNASVDLPEGKYTMKLADTEIFDSRAGRPFFKMVLEVSDGDMKGVQVSKLHSLDDPERFRFLKGDLVTCGLVLSKLSDLPAKMREIHGIHLNVQAKKKDQYTNYYINGRVHLAPDADGDVPF